MIDIYFICVSTLEVNKSRHVMLMLYSCRLVRLPRLLSSSLRVSDLFVLIYSVISLQISIFHCHIIAIYTDCALKLYLKQIGTVHLQYVDVIWRGK